MRIALLLLSSLVLGSFVSGCSKQPEASPKKEAAAEVSAQQEVKAPAITPDQPPIDASAVTAAATGPRPANAPVIPIVLTDPNDLQKTLAELTQALHKYSFEQRRMPKTFSEVIAAGYVQPIPQAPPNKKFEIDSKMKQVVLIKQ